MRHSLISILSLLLVAGTPALAQNSPDGNPDAVGFFEDFAAGLDKGRWYVSDGWTNGDWQDCHWSGSAVQVRGGLLTLFHIPAPEGAARPPRCGEVQTRGFFQYGTFEARIRTPRQSGLNAAVFTYAGPVHGGAPHHEIDIEILTRDPGRMTVNTYVEGKPHNGGVAAAPVPFDDGFHTVAFRWEPEGITWFMDGKEVHRTKAGTPLPNDPQKLYTSFWSTTTLTDWMGEQTAREGPLGYEIDWVAYTPLDKSCLFEASVTCEIR